MGFNLCVVDVCVRADLSFFGSGVLPLSSLLLGGVVSLTLPLVFWSSLSTCCPIFRRLYFARIAWVRLPLALLDPLLDPLLLPPLLFGVPLLRVLFGVPLLRVLLSSSLPLPLPLVLVSLRYKRREKVTDLPLLDVSSRLAQASLSFASLSLLFLRRRSGVDVVDDVDADDTRLLLLLLVLVLVLVLVLLSLSLLLLRGMISWVGMR